MSALTFWYRNWRGETAIRRVKVLGMRWGSTEWHPEQQWLLRALDLDKNAEREFAIKDMEPITADRYDLAAALSPSSGEEGN